MTNLGGISHSTGTGPITGATPDNPVTATVDDPTRQDVDNASNKDTYARVFWEDNGVTHMRAVLVYTKDYTIQAFRWHYGFYLAPRRTDRPSGNGAEKRKNPWEWGYATAENPISEWMAKSPATPAERAQLWEQLAPAYVALVNQDTGAALEAVNRVSLSYGGAFLAEHNKRELMDAIRATIQWDLQDPETRGSFPYMFPDDNTNSGTNSGTQSGTGANAHSMVELTVGTGTGTVITAAGGTG